MRVLLSIQSIGHNCYKKNIPLVPKLTTYFIRLVFGCYIPSELYLPSSTTLGYGALGVVIHKNCKIGERCHIGQNVTLGGSTKDQLVPVLGDDVYIGAGAKILGGISLGDSAIIGANAVVIKDVPAKTTAVGVPARSL
jgi:serine O-acetyltransferase